MNCIGNKNFRGASDKLMEQDEQEAEDKEECAHEEKAHCNDYYEKNE